MNILILNVWILILNSMDIFNSFGIELEFLYNLSCIRLTVSSLNKSVKR